MDPKEKFREILRAAIGDEELAITIERPANPEHGDYASNVAMQLAKRLRRNPRQVAEEIARASANAIAETGLFEPLVVAGAGFLNLRVKPSAKLGVIERVLAEGARYGAARPAKAEHVQVEFVSANPTGPLHVGHGRGAAYGASLAALLEFAGHRVAREFYVNDAGRQMDILALSVWLRYLEARGKRLPFPDDGYRGDYVRDIATALLETHGDSLDREAVVLPQRDDPDATLDAQIEYAKKVLAEGWRVLHGFALEAMLADQRDDLAAFRVSFDRWYSEQSLHDSGMIEKALKTLQANDHLYEQEGALWFRSTAFGDEKDRVVRRENGQPTLAYAPVTITKWQPEERRY